MGTAALHRLDAVATQHAGGLLAFAAVMTGLFVSIFALADLPMDLIELLFWHLRAALYSLLPPGAVRSLVADGLVAGLAGTVVFVPQIFLLFFLISGSR